MARVLDLPYAALGNIKEKRPMSISVLRLPPASDSANAFDAARKSTKKRTMMGLPPHAQARDSAFAKWESVPLPTGLRMDQALMRVVDANSTEARALKFRLRFCDCSEITFERSKPDLPSSLRFQGFYSPNGAFDRQTAKKVAERRAVLMQELSPLCSANGKRFQPPKLTVKMKFPDPKALLYLFQSLDPNSNGVLSLAELDKAVIQLWPAFNNKPAIMRAYKAADKNGSGWIGRNEFEYFLRYLIHYNTLWHVFKEIDKNGDRRLNVAEFLEGAERVGYHGSPDELRRVFSSMDRNAGGVVLFDEFCSYLATNKTQYEMPKFTPTQMPKVKSPSKKPQTAASPARTLVIPGEEKRNAMFRRMDPNGNGILSLAELDKAIIELWPGFNNKPAIMRAYKAADRNGTGFIGKKEFEYFLRFLVYYTNMWNAFRGVDVDKDRRVSINEFIAGASKLGLTKSEAELRTAFKSMDSNRGGYVLFEEFCAWLAANKAQYEMPLSLPPTPLPRSRSSQRDRKPKPPPKKRAPLKLPDSAKRKNLFSRIDPNGNGWLSLAELDKAIIELWPDFDNKPAIMRAYKAADKSGNGWLGRKEFAYFLTYLVYYTNLWYAFADIDTSDDRRVSEEEFLAGAQHADINLPEDSLVAVFNQMDKNGGGYVLFREFCEWMAKFKADTEAPEDE